MKASRGAELCLGSFSCSCQGYKPLDSLGRLCPSETLGGFSLLDGVSISETPLPLSALATEIVGCLQSPLTHFIFFSWHLLHRSCAHSNRYSSCFLLQRAVPATRAHLAPGKPAWPLLSVGPARRAQQVKRREQHCELLK